MAAGEGGGGTLAGIVGDVEQVVAEAVAPTGRGHALTMREEPVAEIGEDALCYLVGAHGEVVELGPSDGQQDENDIVGKEGAEYDEGAHLELLIALEEVVEKEDEHQREVGDIAQAHQLREPPPRHGLREEQRRLTAKDSLFPTSKNMVKVGQHTVQFVGVGVPP